jgi:ABC-type phosphate/phosphonate transport system substrate-binding protein
MPPIVVAKRLPVSLKEQLRAALTYMHHDPAALKGLHQGMIRRLAPVTDEHYNDIRCMVAVVRDMTFPFI